MIVFPDPIRGEVPNLIEIAPKVLRQPFISDCPIESLDIGILLRLAGLDVLELNPRLFSPAGDRPADIFLSVVTSNRVRLPTPGDDPVIEDWLSAAAPRMGLYPDFEKVVFSPDVPITTDMVRLITSSPLAADMAYYLGTHKMESLAISKMSLADAAQSLSQLEARLKSTKLP